MLNIFNVQSNILNQLRTIRVYTPTGYALSNERFPVIYMHDGQNVFRDEAAIGGSSLSLEQMFDEHQSQIIVVGIDCKEKHRVWDYCPWQAGEYCKQFSINPSWQPNGQQYISFVTYELKSFIDCHYRTEVNNTAIAGISLGGLISSYATCTFPAIYQRVAVFSSSFYRNQEELENLINRSDLSQVKKIHMDCGSLESEIKEINHAFIQSNERVAQAFQTELTIVENGRHDYISFKKRVPNVLMNLFSK